MTAQRRSRMRHRARWVLVVLVLATVSCVSVGPIEEGAASAERPFLLSPSEGWRGELTGEAAQRLHELHYGLVERNEQAAALHGAQELARSEPQLMPARVLEAQARHLGGHRSTVLEILGPVLADYPEFVAAAVLYGRAAEQSDRVADAFAAYYAVRSESAVAARRVGELRDAAASELAGRFEQQMALGRLDAAEQTVGQLREWAPGSEHTSKAAAALSAATTDPREQLEALRALPGSDGGDPELTRRRAELEIQIGDPAIAVRLAEGLVAASPNDLYATHLLERARFQWRLGLLPVGVEPLGRTAELSRSEFAVLLYWLFPQVRYGRSEEARIATDVIDHPQRDAIVRVINLGLLDVDPTIHRFSPEAPVARQDALEGFLRLLEMNPETAACLEGGRVPASPEYLCRSAASCRLIAEEAECLPEAALSGAQALELSRRTLSRLGTE